MCSAWPATWDNEAKAEATGQARPGHSPAAGAAPQQAEPASAGKTEPVGRGGTPASPVTQHATIWLLTWMKQSEINDLQRDIYIHLICTELCHNAPPPSQRTPPQIAGGPVTTTFLAKTEGLELKSDTRWGDLLLYVCWKGVELVCFLYLLICMLCYTEEFQ